MSIDSLYSDLYYIICENLEYHDLKNFLRVNKNLSSLDSDDKYKHLMVNKYIEISLYNGVKKLSHKVLGSFGKPINMNIDLNKSISKYRSDVLIDLLDKKIEHNNIEFMKIFFALKGCDKYQLIYTKELLCRSCSHDKFEIFEMILNNIDYSNDKLNPVYIFNYNLKYIKILLEKRLIQNNFDDIIFDNNLNCKISNRNHLNNVYYFLSEKIKNGETTSYMKYNLLILKLYYYIKSYTSQYWNNHKKLKCKFRDQVGNFEPNHCLDCQSIYDNDMAIVLFDDIMKLIVDNNRTNYDGHIDHFLIKDILLKCIELNNMKMTLYIIERYDIKCDDLILEIMCKHTSFYFIKRMLYFVDDKHFYNLFENCCKFNQHELIEFLLDNYKISDDVINNITHLTEIVYDRNHKKILRMLYDVENLRKNLRYVDRLKYSINKLF